MVRFLISTPFLGIALIGNATLILNWVLNEIVLIRGNAVYIY